MSFQFHPEHLALQPGSLVLVSGASGYLGSHIVREALLAGYKVRGTVRSQEKSSRTSKLHASDNYSTVIVEDMSSPDAFNEAIKGVDAVIHSASSVPDVDPMKVVEPTVRAITGVMQAMLKEESIKRFVYTSSCTAASSAIPGKKFHIGTDTWNTTVENMTFDGKKELSPEQAAELSYDIYMLSKTKAERAVWAFVGKENPSWEVNCILPDTIMGKVLDTPGLTGQLCIDILNGKRIDKTPQYSINVTDCARLHLAALIDSTVSKERLLLYDEPYNVNKIGQVIESITGKKTIDQDPNELEDLSTTDNARGAGLLKKWWGQDGYQGLYETVKQNIEGHY